MNEIKGAFPRLVGKLAVAAAVNAAAKYLPGSTSMGGPSSLAGEPWGWQQYAAAAVTAIFAPKLLGKFVNATEFRRGAIDLIMTKLVWTNVISRVPMAQQWFGAIGDQVYDSDGQGWIEDNGQMHALQGLVTSGPLDGLVTSGPMDGYLPSTTSRSESLKSAYRGTGSSDPYAY